VAEPTIDTAKELMHHPDVRVLLVTGGPAVVKEALRTDKRAVTAGPGNPPVVVDRPRTSSGRRVTSWRGRRSTTT
jgi:acyl-CoA reductase-like NAD-dependent aldehyde dehydrogenase